MCNRWCLTYWNLHAYLLNIILCYIILENLLFAQVMKLNGNLTDIRVWKVFHKHKDQCKTMEAESGSSLIYYIITG